MALSPQYGQPAYEAKSSYGIRSLYLSLFRLVQNKMQRQQKDHDAILERFGLQSIPKKQDQPHITSRARPKDKSQGILADKNQPKNKEQKHGSRNSD